MSSSITPSLHIALGNNQFHLSLEDSCHIKVSTETGSAFFVDTQAALTSIPIHFNLKTAVKASEEVQDFDPQSLTMGVEHSQMVKAAPIASDCGSKDCAYSPDSTAVFRFNGLSFTDGEKQALIDQVRKFIQKNQADRAFQRLLPFIEKQGLKGVFENLNISGCDAVRVLLITYILSFLEDEVCNKRDAEVQKNILKVAHNLFSEELILDGITEMLKEFIPMKQWGNKISAYRDILALISIVEQEKNCRSLSVISIPSSLEEILKPFFLIVKAACKSREIDFRVQIEEVFLSDVKKILSEIRAINFEDPLIKCYEQLEKFLHRVLHFIEQEAKIVKKIRRLSAVHKIDEARGLYLLLKRQMTGMSANFHHLLFNFFIFCGSHFNSPKIKALFLHMHEQLMSLNERFAQEVYQSILVILTKYLKSQNTQVINLEDAVQLIAYYKHCLSSISSFFEYKELPPLPENPLNASCYQIINQKLRGLTLRYETQLTHLTKKIANQYYVSRLFENDLKTGFEYVQDSIQRVLLEKQLEGFEELLSKFGEEKTLSWDQFQEHFKSNIYFNYFFYLEENREIKARWTEESLTDALAGPDIQEGNSASMITAFRYKEILEKYEELTHAISLPALITQFSCPEGGDLEVDATEFLQELEEEASLLKIQKEEIGAVVVEEEEEACLSAPLPLSSEIEESPLLPIQRRFLNVAKIARLSQKSAKIQKHQGQALYYYQQFAAFLQWAERNPRVHLGFASAFINAGHLSLEQEASSLVPDMKGITTHRLPERLKQLGFSLQMASDASIVNPYGTLLVRYPGYRTRKELQDTMASVYLAKASSGDVEDACRIAKDLFNQTFRLMVKMQMEKGDLGKISHEEIEAYDAVQTVLALQVPSFVAIDIPDPHFTSIASYYSQTRSLAIRVLLNDLKETFQLLKESREFPRNCYDLLSRHIQRSTEAIIFHLLKEHSAPGNIEMMIDHISIHYSGTENLLLSRIRELSSAFILQKRNDYPIEFGQEWLIREHIAAFSEQGFEVSGREGLALTDKDMHDHLNTLIENSMALLVALFEFKRELLVP